MAQVFITGATGYIGGSILARFSDNYPNYKFRALTRNADKANKLSQFPNIEGVVGDNNSSDVLEREAKNADIVIHTANSADDLPSTQAIVKGIEAGKGKQAIYIHVSGTGALVDDARGMHDQHATYDDSDSKHINTLDIKQVHRDVDTFLLEHSANMQLHIVYPSTIWGQASDHKLSKAGISNPFSVQMPALARAAIDLKQAKVVGEGKNVWPNVHIYELVDLFELILKHALSGAISSDANGSYFFGAVDEYRYKDAVQIIAKALAQHGIAPESVGSFTDAECQKYFGGYYFGSNCRATSSRSKSLGWDPKLGTKDFFADLPNLVEDLIKSGSV
ncbi:hypothetical protein E3P99_03366 [Wallemia hederae]|uniref:NAD(P)-binding domain-containing protein n=1 Tax=Wallemia hederae TaxID=1540922 RepID=A0A4T0FKA2_9BASI|nr:hypothetical protein E3P99_03366 [Wallemia hederae]